MHEHARLGRFGEQLAADLFCRLGYEVLERNWRSAEGGELDLVVRRGDTVVFCEVKTRRSDRFGQPCEAVGRLKQLRLRRLAAAWLSEHAPGPVKVRFDVVSVLARDPAPEVTHLPDAF